VSRGYSAACSVDTDKAAACFFREIVATIRAPCQSSISTASADARLSARALAVSSLSQFNVMASQKCPSEPMIYARYSGIIVVSGVRVTIAIHPYATRFRPAVPCESLHLAMGRAVVRSLQP
jgi:hypothetical protein